MLSSQRADRQTHRLTDTKVNTEDTLSGIQEFFLQPIIKDQFNNDDNNDNDNNNNPKLLSALII